ncbi:MAG: hypothetical protein HON90_05910 [Halobacteriovoraceae bacterium]|nr:hypothetical protein [Halobacteriovoraceae bacterium]
MEPVTHLEQHRETKNQDLLDMHSLISILENTIESLERIDHMSEATNIKTLLKDKLSNLHPSS